MAGNDGAEMQSLNLDELPFQPHFEVTINGNCYVVKLRTKCRDKDEFLYRHLSVDMNTGETLEGFDYVAASDV